MINVKMDGRAVPALGFGTLRLSGAEGTRLVRSALDTGYRHIDTAQDYRNEAEVGEALAGARLPREQVFVTTKLGRQNLAAAAVRQSTEDSLRKLGVDYIDLLLIHWPSPTVPLAETLDAMGALKSQGKIRAIGVSNFTVDQMRQAVETHGYEIACNQVEYHVFMAQRPVMAYARSHGIIITAYSPVARGKVLENETMRRIGDKHGKNAAQIALRWLVEQPETIAIPRSSSDQNIRANFDIFDFALDDSDRAAIAALDRQERLVNPEWAPVWDQP